MRIELEILKSFGNNIAISHRIDKTRFIVKEIEDVLKKHDAIMLNISILEENDA